MEKNPFNELLSIIRDEIKKCSKSPLITGIVKSPLPNLLIETNGIMLDKDNLEIDYKLKNDINNPLSEGDKVVLLRQGDFFLVLNKVVKI